MGKWILYALLLLNLIAFLWFYSNSEEELDLPKQQTRALLNSEKISIVKSVVNSELEKQTAPTTVPEQLPDTGTQKEEMTEDPLQAIINQKVDDKSLIEKTAPKQIEVVTLVTEPTVREQTDNTQPATQSQEEQNLLNEMASFASRDVTAIEPSSVLPMFCYQYGPLDQTQAEAITVVMQQQQIPVVQQSRVVVEPRGFLVLIMPQRNSDAAKSQMRIARNAGLDAFVITKGEWNNGVSLGIFTTKENADKLFTTAKGLIPNSQVAIKKRVRESEVYRILFKLKNDQDPAILLANNPFPSFNSKNPLQKTTKIAKKSCETVEF